MIPVHHLSDDLLLRYTSGRLSAAPLLVVESHLALCPHCRARAEDFAGIGGMMVDVQQASPLAPDLFEKVLARIEGEKSVAVARSGQIRLKGHQDWLPAPLRSRDIGPWRWMGPGMRFARVDVPEDPAVKLVLIGIQPGRALPMHGHSGSELTLVLQGAFRDRSGRYGVGDMAEEEDDDEHQPLIEDGVECICLAAIEGRMKPQNLLARIAMPLFGF